MPASTTGLRMYRSYTRATILDKLDPRENPSRLFLIIALNAVGYDQYEKNSLFPKFKHHANSLFQQVIDGKVKPVPNEFQKTLGAMFPETDSIHIYVGTVRGDVPTHYMAWAKNADGLFIPRHTKIRKVPERLARDGVILAFGRMTPLPEYALERPPSIIRVYTGGKAGQDLIHELDSERTGHETGRQISHVAMQSSLVGSLHRNRLTLYSNPGAITLEVDFTQGDGCTTPFGLTPIRVRDYNPTPTQKPRIVAHTTASSDGLMVKPGGRCILAQVKNASAYTPPRGEGTRNAGVYLTFLLKTRLVPYVGIEEPDGSISVVGLAYNPDEDRAYMALFAGGRTERACAGLPVLRIADRRAETLRWLPDHALAELLASAIWDASPDPEAVRLRWLAISKVFLGFRVSQPEEYVRFYAELGMPLPAGSEEHIAARIKAEADYMNALERSEANA